MLITRFKTCGFCVSNCAILGSKSLLKGKVMSINNVIIATDFSKHAEYALKRSLLFTKYHNATLELIHVLKQPLLENFIQFSSDEQQKQLLALEKNMQEKLTNLVKQCSSSSSVNTAVLLGRAAEEIVRLAQQQKSDLIIAGSHGQYHISDYVLGTTSGDIIRQGNTPVLLIKKEPSFAYNKILVATDFSKTSQKAVEFAFQCFPEAQFQLLHIVDIHNKQFTNFSGVDNHEMSHPTKDILLKLDDFLKSCDVKHEQFEKKVIGGYLADTIIMQSKNWNADLVVFGSQGHSKLHNLLVGSVAKRILTLSTIDMLTVPPHKSSLQTS